MEAPRQRRSRVVCTAKRSSGEGFRQTQKHRKGATFASDSGSSSSGLEDEDQLMFDLGRGSSRRPAGTPIKHLLANEMSKESESRRRSQSVIARLMGLQGPPPQPAQKLPRRYPDEHRASANVGKAERISPFSSHRSSRKNSKEEQEFKDVFEVVEAPKVDRNGYRSVGSAADSDISSLEMEFIRQKFMEAKRLSTDDKLHDSKEFHDAIEVLDSNRDLLVKFLQQPNSLFTKHINDLEVAPFPSHFSQISTSKSSKAYACDASHHGFSSGLEKLPKRSSRSSAKRKEKLSGHSYYSPLDSLKASKSEERKNSDSAPTRIVVLKPNLEKINRSIKSSASSPESDSSSLEEFPSIRTKELEQARRKKLNGDVDLKLQLNGSREISKKMKDESYFGSPNIFPLKLRGYGGDNSSAVSMNDSANESDITILTSTKSSHCNSHGKLGSCSTESSVSREAKRRLSRRWKMAHKSEDMGELNRGSTLADMLAIPDHEARCRNEDRNGRKGFASPDLIGALGEPLGISSRDGWKDVCVNNLSRSRSVPSSSNFSGSPRANAGCEAPRKYMIPRETMRWEKNKKIITHVDPVEALSHRKLRPKQSEHHPRHFLRGEASSVLQEFHPRPNQPKAGGLEMNPLELSPLVSEASPGKSHENLKVEHATHPSSKETFCSQLPTPLISTFNDGGVSPEPSDGLSKEISGALLHPVHELQSPASSKEADQPSPVSTLEAPFTDDLSSGSECFESLSADLRGLRMQLQLLKLESESYGEGTIVVCSDDETGEGSCNALEDGAADNTEGSWDYVTDILVFSGLIDYDPETYVSKLQSPEYPVDPSVFEELEKKHSSESFSRAERKLLFDRLNSGLKDIYLQLTSPNPWVMARGPAWGIKPSRDRDGLLDGLRRSLVGRDKKANKGTLDKVLINESQWLELGDDFDVIGKEIERLLVDDIVAEVVIELNLRL